MTNNNIERRCAERIAISLPVTLKVDHSLLSSKMLDISLCGMSLICSDKIAENKPLNISLTLPSYDQNNQLNLSANVTRCLNIKNQFLIGLAFNHLTPHENLTIKEFCTFHQRLSS